MSHGALLPVPPGDLGPPIVGHTLSFVADPLAFMQSRARRYGPVFKANIIGRPTVFMLGPEANRFILATKLDDLSWREGYGAAAQSLFGNALIMQDGPAYAETKRLVLPVFAKERLRVHLESIHVLVRRELEDACGRGRIELYGMFKRLALGIAYQVMVGTAPRSVAESLADFNAFSAGLFTPFRWKLPGSTYGKAWRARGRLRRELIGVVSRRRAQGDLHPHGDLLSALIAARLDTESIVSHLMLMLFAGHDTTASLVTWLSREVFVEPRHASLILAEIADSCPGGLPSPEDLHSLGYLGACIREAERLYPPAPTGFRGVRETLNFGGYRIPAGWCVVYSPVFTHRMEQWFERPDRFEPKRPPARPYTHIAFGGGPRKCPGEALAHVELRAIFWRLIRDYEVELETREMPGLQYVPALHPRCGLPGTIRPRRGGGLVRRAN